MNNLEMITNSLDLMDTMITMTSNIKQEKSSYVHREKDGAEFRKATAGEPIRNQEDLKQIFEYFQLGESASNKAVNLRNQIIFIIGITTGLRISDILKLRFRDVIDIGKVNKYKLKKNQKLTESTIDIFRNKILVCEQKTGKMNNPMLNNNVKKLLLEYLNLLNEYDISYELSDCMWIKNKAHKLSVSDKPLAKNTYYEMLQRMYNSLKWKEDFHMSTHTMRKTFGYWVFKNASNKMESLAILQELFNHSSQRVTLRYIGLTEENKRKSFDDINNMFDSLM